MYFHAVQRRLTSNALDPADETPIYTVEGKIEAEDDDLYQGQVKPLIYGYLHKLSRSGKWQLRFFETDGESLSYFKSEKRVKLLATLDLFKVRKPIGNFLGLHCVAKDMLCGKVGTITMSAEDPTGCTFSIQVADRPYSLRAESKSTCKDWVITLNRIKEARMQVGGVKLVTPKFHVQPPDLLDENGGRTHDIAPRVVLVANRQRTRAVATENPQAWEQLVQNQVQYNPPKVWVGPKHTSQRSQRLALGRWNKRQNAFHNLKLRLLQWARSLRKKATCTPAEGDVVTSDSSSKRDDIASEKKEAEMSMSRRMDRDDSSTWSEAEETKVEISPQIFDDEGEARQLA